jgi:hypothetical protein
VVSADESDRPGIVFRMLSPPTAHEPLPLARYRFTAAFERDLVLPAFAGPLLRSVFGLALRQGACSTGAPRCEGCALAPGCAYTALFAAPPRPTQLQQRIAVQPQVLEPPPLGTLRVPAGRPLVWHQVLIGAEALRERPLVVHAWRRGLASGWGEARVRGRLLDVAWLDADGAPVSVYDAAAGRLLPHAAALAWQPPAAAAGVQVAHLEFLSPLRLQHEGRVLRPDELGPRKLVADLLRRCNVVLDLLLGIRPAPFDAPALVAHAATLADDRAALHWRDDVRYSARQRQEVPLGGVLGRWTLRGGLGPLLPWLWLGQWLHLGKNTTHGLGAYRLTLEGAAA